MKVKTQKGITLIALIITIVVLLILAVVAINSIQNDGILSYAQNATTQFEQGQETEEGILAGHVNYLNNINVGNETTAKTISFTIRMVDYSGSHDETCFGEEGMTWAEWCASSYNAGEEIFGEGLLFETDDVGVYLPDGSVSNYILIDGSPEDVIVSGEVYTFELDHLNGGWRRRRIELNTFI